jgi:hypothetical protein
LAQFLTLMMEAVRSTETLVSCVAYSSTLKMEAIRSSVSELHGVTTRKTTLLIVISVRTSNQKKKKKLSLADDVPSGFASKIAYVFVIFNTRATCTTCLVILDLIAVIIFDGVKIMKRPIFKYSQL